MPTLVQALKLVAVLLAATLLGNWFLAEVKKARRRNLPWYSVYLSPPGLLIIAAIVVPLVYWLAQP
jgi:hypothetical protein